MYEVPEHDTRGMAEFAQDIFLQGRVEKYDGQNEIQSLSSEEANFFSENLSDDEDNKP